MIFADLLRYHWVNLSIKRLKGVKIKNLNVLLPKKNVSTRYIKYEWQLLFTKSIIMAFVCYERLVIITLSTFAYYLLTKQLT